MSATSPLVIGTVNHLTPVASREPSNEKNEAKRKNTNGNVHFLPSGPTSEVTRTRSGNVEIYGKIAIPAIEAAAKAVTNKELEKQLARLRHAIEIASLDYRRTVQEMVKREYTQSQIAVHAGVTQPAVAKILKAASRDAQLQAGKVAATITEACKRYAIESLSRSELIDFLSHFDYKDEGKPNEFGEYENGYEGTIFELETAESLGLIDEGVILEVEDRREARAKRAGE